MPVGGTSGLVAGLAAPSHAAGATAFVTAGNDVHYIGNDNLNRVLVTSDFTGAVVVEEPLSGITPGSGCARVTDTKVRCVASPGNPAVDFVKLQLAGGSDEARVQTSVRTLVEGGSGDDAYVGATTSTGTTVVFNGGSGLHDRADYGFSTSGVLVALGTNGAGDQPGDGRLGKDNDNIDRTVEDLFGSNHQDSLRGNESDNWIIGRLGADALRGGPGDDEIWADESNPVGSEADRPDLSCGTGIDTIILDNVDPGTAECEIVRRVA